jgi:hypothetical protein
MAEKKLKAAPKKEAKKSLKGSKKLDETKLMMKPAVLHKF